MRYIQTDWEVLSYNLPKFQDGISLVTMFLQTVGTSEWETEAFISIKNQK